MKLSDLNKFNQIVIQCHDNPDADALASGFGLYTYFKDQNKDVKFIYRGFNKVQKSNLTIMLKELDIPVEYAPDYNENPELLITVDCQHGQRNVTTTEAQNIAIIDHHQKTVELPELSEVRSNLGSASTLVWDMIRDEGEEAAKLIKGAEIFISATLKHYVKNEQSIFETDAGGALIEITKEAEAPVEPEVRPDPVEASIAELNAMEGEIKDKTFLVTGVIEAMKNDKFGNAYLTDPVSKETIMLYGATTTETAIAYADGSFSWTNPKDAETTLEGIEDGMQVTMEVMFKLFNNTPEIFGIVKESSEFPFPYSVEVEENEDGVITPSKVAEVEYGEEITLEVEPAEGKKLKSLVVENAQGVKKDITEALKFNATCVNKVVATFEDAGAVLTQTLVDADKLGITGSYSDSAEAAKIDGADWMFKECMKSGTGAIQTRYKNSKASEVYNTTALAADVASVTFVFSADQTQTKDLLYVVAGAESVAEAGQSDANAMKLTWDGTEEGRTVTIEIPANLNARFLKLGHTTTSGAAYIQSVTINYRA